jgi:VanZ family protein
VAFRPVVQNPVVAIVFASIRAAAESVPGRILPPVAWIVVSFLLSHQPTLPYPPDISAQVVSVMGHVGVFGVLAALIWWALGLAEMSLARRAGVAILLTVIYGFLDEWHQSFVPGRTPDIRDIVADTIGATLAMLAVTWLARRVGVRRSHAHHEDSLAGKDPVEAGYPENRSRVH